MNDFPPNRRACQIEGAYALAVLYTLGYLGMVGALMFFEIPANNRELLIGLVGIMSAAQLAVIKHYYDGSKVAETAQIANIARAAKSEAVLQDIAKAAPVVVASITPTLTDVVQPKESP